MCNSEVEANLFDISPGDTEGLLVIVQFRGLGSTTACST